LESVVRSFNDDSSKRSFNDDSRKTRIAVAVFIALFVILLLTLEVE
jgi:hypothetical protein